MASSLSLHAARQRARARQYLVGVLPNVADHVEYAILYGLAPLGNAVTFANPTWSSPDVLDFEGSAGCLRDSTDVDPLEPHPSCHPGPYTGVKMKPLVPVG